MPHLAVFAGLHPADVQRLCPRQYGSCAKNSLFHPKFGRTLPRSQRQSPQSNIDPPEMAIRGQTMSVFGIQSTISPRRSDSLGQAAHGDQPSVPHHSLAWHAVVDDVVRFQRSRIDYGVQFLDSVESLARRLCLYHQLCTMLAKDFSPGLYPSSVNAWNGGHRLEVLDALLGSSLT